MKIRRALLALTALALPGAAGTVSVEAHGTVLGSSIQSGPFAGAAAGTSVKMTFDVTTPGFPTSLGKFENFLIVVPSFVLDVGGTTMGLGSAPPLGMMNDFPVADGVFIFLTQLAQPGHGIEFELHDSTGTVFDTTDIAQLAATYPGSTFDTVDWNLFAGGGQAGIALSSLVIHPETGAAIGTPYCASTVNSSGNQAQIGAAGSTSVAANDVTLHATGLPPGQNGIFFYGATETQIPFAGGFLCVSGAVQRLVPAILSSPAGTMDFQFDLSIPPASSGPFAITPGSTWKFQGWFRDPPTISNLTNGLSITFTN